MKSEEIPAIPGMRPDGIVKDEKGRFVKGFTGNPKGNQKGIRREGQIIKGKVYQVFQEHLDKGDFKEWAAANKSEFYRMTASLLPKECDVSGEINVESHAFFHHLLERAGLVVDESRYPNLSRN